MVFLSFFFFPVRMGKRKLGESDDEDSSDEEDEKSVVLNYGNGSVSNKEDERSSEDSVTGGKQDVECSGGVSCSEEEEEPSEEQFLKSNSGGEIAPDKEGGMVEALMLKETVAQSANVTCLAAAEVSETETMKTDEQENIEPDSKCADGPSSGNGETVEGRPVVTKANDFPESNGAIIDASVRNADLEKPLNFDKFNSASELEVCM